GEDHPMVHRLKAIQHQLDAFSSYHPGIGELAKRLYAAQIELQDIAGEIGSLNDRVTHDPGRMEQLNERLSQGYRLLKKHGVKTTDELLAVQQELSGKLQAVLDIDARIAELESEVNVLWKQVADQAAEISGKRQAQVKP